MCEGCYEEYGRPNIINEITISAAKLIERVYSFSEVGGNLHIHLEDWNIEDEYFEEFVVYRIEASEYQISAEKECFSMLKAMTLKERASALAIAHGYTQPI